MARHQNRLEAIRLKPREAEFYYYLGGALEELGRRREAVEAYAQALRIDPGLSERVNVCRPHRRVNQSR